MDVDTSIVHVCVCGHCELWLCAHTKSKLPCRKIKKSHVLREQKIEKWFIFSISKPSMSEPDKDEKGFGCCLGLYCIFYAAFEYKFFDSIRQIEQGWSCSHRSHDTLLISFAYMHVMYLSTPISLNDLYNAARTPCVFISFYFLWILNRLWSWMQVVSSEQQWVRPMDIFCFCAQLISKKYLGLHEAYYRRNNLKIKIERKSENYKRIK